jgi:hypothetical protein
VVDPKSSFWLGHRMYWAHAMAITLLVPTSIPRRCYLMEALLWVEVNRFPLSSRTVEGGQEDDRENIDYLEVYPDPRFPYDLTITDEECDQLGLPPNPAYEALKSNKVFKTPDTLRGFIKWTGTPEWYRRRCELQLPESEAFYKRKAEWDLKFGMIRDGAKAKLLTALQGDRVKAFGIRIDSDDLRELKFARPDSPPVTPPENPTWTPISERFWTSKGVHWESCWAESGASTYLLILLDTARLLESFPPPTREPFLDAVRIGTSLALRDTRDTVDRLSRPRAGRRSYPWAEILAEATRRVRAGGLPAKQDAFAADMCDWCRKKYPRAPGRSTMAAQLRVFYD